MLTYTIKYPKNLKLLFAVIDSNKFLVIKTLQQVFYFTIPNFIKLNIQANQISFSYSEPMSTQGLLVIQNCTKWLHRFEKYSAKKLVLKGLGLKATLLKQNLLELKLGFSHIIHLEIPLIINITLLKNIILLESSDSVLLGNFANKIRSLKKPDSYKGKGVWYKNEIKVLKVVKKT